MKTKNTDTPSPEKESRDCVFQMRLNDSEYELLEAISARTGDNKSTVIRKAIEAYIDGMNGYS